MMSSFPSHSALLRWRHRPLPDRFNVRASEQPRRGGASVGLECQECPWRGSGDQRTAAYHVKTAHPAQGLKAGCHVYYPAAVPASEAEALLRKERARERNRRYRARLREQAASEVGAREAVGRAAWSWKACYACALDGHVLIHEGRKEDVAHGQCHCHSTARQAGRMRGRAAVSAGCAVEPLLYHGVHAAAEPA